jgi:hypothetical protein
MYPFGRVFLMKLIVNKFIIFILVPLSYIASFKTIEYIAENFI